MRVERYLEEAHDEDDFSYFRVEFRWPPIPQKANNTAPSLTQNLVNLIPVRSLAVKLKHGLTRRVQFQYPLPLLALSEYSTWHLLPRLLYPSSFWSYMKCLPWLFQQLYLPDFKTGVCSLISASIRVHGHKILCCPLALLLAYATPGGVRKPLFLEPHPWMSAILRASLISHSQGVCPVFLSGFWISAEYQEKLNEAIRAKSVRTPNLATVKF
jgi:hypothetical protein